MSDIVERINTLKAKVDAFVDIGLDELASLSLDMLAEAITEIERLRALTEWRPIETAEPPHETMLLLYSPPWSHAAGQMEVACASTGRRVRLSDGSLASSMSQHGSATHWLPLPPPPEQKP